MPLEQLKDVKPFLKWAGGKKQLLDVLRNYYPIKRTGLKKYCEPFVGGGAVFFDIIGHCSFEQIYLSDTNTELVNAYKAVRDQVDELCALLQGMKDKYLSLEEKEQSDYYYHQRAAFNALKMKGNSQENLQCAALFLFLNRTCFNGLYRENSKGMFNVPIGRYKNPAIFDRDNLDTASRILKNVELHCGDYSGAKEFIDENTFVYFDPPYRPLSQTASFTSYNQAGFDDAEQIRLAQFVAEIHKNGAFFLLSNSDPKNTDQNDMFFDDLYQGFQIERIQAKRMINSKAASRGSVNEIIVTNINM